MVDLQKKTYAHRAGNPIATTVKNLPSYYNQKERKRKNENERRKVRSNC